MSQDKNTPDLLDRMLNIVKLFDDDRDSIAEVSDMASLTPVVLTGNDVVNALDTETLHNIYQLHLSLYTAMWLKAASLLLPANATGDVTVEELLAPISDRRPRVTNSRALEALKEFIADLTLENMDGYIASEDGSLLDAYDAENYKEGDVAKPSNLAVGKLIYVPIRINKTEIQQPITVRVKPHLIDVDFLNRVLLAFVGKDQNIMGRWNRYISGEIEGRATYLLGLDILREDRKLRLEDKDGIYSLMKENKARGTINTIAKGQKQDYNVASNMTVMTQASRRGMETAMRGKLTNFRTREEYFKTTGSMILSIVDPVSQVITVFTVGQRDYGVYALDDLKARGSNGGTNDIDAMLKSFKLGESFNL